MVTSLVDAVKRVVGSLRIAFSHRDFALLATGQLFGQTATSMQVVVVSWQVYELTGSSLSVGLTGLFRAVPLLLLSLVGGVVADSMDRKKVLLASQFVTLAVAIGLAVLTSAGQVSTLAIYAGMFVVGAATAFDFPARRALVPTLVREEAVQPAVTSNLIVRRGSGIFGPALGGTLIALFGTAAGHWAVASCVLVLIACLVLMRSPRAARPASPRSGAALLEGFRFLWTMRPLLGILVMAFFLFMFVNSRSAWPALVRDVFDSGPTALGLLGSSEAAGTVIGLGIALALGQVRRTGLVSILCAMGLGVCVVGLSVAPTLYAAVMALVVFGVVDSINDSVRNTLIATATPNHLQGRVNSVSAVFGSGGVSLGDLWIGFLAESLGPRRGLGLAGSCVVIGTALVLLLARPLVRFEGAQRKAP